MRVRGMDNERNGKKRGIAGDGVAKRVGEKRGSQRGRKREHVR